MTMRLIFALLFLASPVLAQSMPPECAKVCAAECTPDGLPYGCEKRGKCADCRCKAGDKAYCHDAPKKKDADDASDAQPMGGKDCTATCGKSPHDCSVCNGSDERHNPQSPPKGSKHAKGDGK